MSIATAGSVAPKTRKGRAGTARPDLNICNNSTNTDSATSLRLQRLRLLGIIGARANLLAGMAWEVRHG